MASDPLERLRPLAGRGRDLRLAMSDAVEKTFGEEVERIPAGESEEP